MEATGIAVVTGASRGLGRAIALELAARGFEVWATMRDVAAGAELGREAAERGLPLRLARLDVTRPDDFEFPDGLRVLVNNAGVRLQYLPLEETSLDEWRQVFETNVFGLAEVSRRAIPRLRASGGGVLCNVTSASIFTPQPFFATYRASKWAVSAMCETLRAELAPFGIRVVEILPGPIDTDLARDSVLYRLPEAVRFPAYRDTAQRHYPALRTMPELVMTSPEVAARSVADAILQDDGPMRYGCDPVSTSLLEMWRTTSDEELMQAALARYRKGS
jgi:NAD(P)-dependent dehydrogenase (short-subunit alcohol dehydrogenase family)